VLCWRGIKAPEEQGASRRVHPLATVIFLKALHLSESGIFTRSHSPKATPSPISVALLIARGLSGSTERMNVRVRNLYPKADCRPGTES
jgi:hypothetical protein